MPEEGKRIASENLVSAPVMSMARASMRLMVAIVVIIRTDCGQ